MTIYQQLGSQVEVTRNLLTWSSRRCMLIVHGIIWRNGIR